jgi:hypothetical protein
VSLEGLYRARPITVEAFQLRREPIREHESLVDAIPLPWWAEAQARVAFLWASDGVPWRVELDGGGVAGPGDWLVRVAPDFDGAMIWYRVWALSAAEFVALYEPLEQRRSHGGSIPRRAI